MGYMEFSTKRYWDLREVDTFYRTLTPIAKEKSLPSDASKRNDTVTLKETGDFD